VLRTALVNIVEVIPAIKVLKIMEELFEI